MVATSTRTGMIIPARWVYILTARYRSARSPLLLLPFKKKLCRIITSYEVFLY
uniref:Uncharacterized protein n=1 Tax=Solanum lycopersicum TaxID=4081 RepID=A0A3Q7EB83_SOLLC